MVNGIQINHIWLYLMIKGYDTVWVDELYSTRKKTKDK